MNYLFQTAELSGLGQSIINAISISEHHKAA